MNPLISVITLTHNKLDYTRKCLGSLLETAYTPWELIVVDNGSTDGTAAWLKVLEEEAHSVGVRVRVIRNPGNIGCSTARNQGLANAAGVFTAFVDNDVALRDRPWLAKLSTVLAENTKVGLVGPKLVYPFAPYRIQCAGAAVSRSGRIQFAGRGEERNDPRFTQKREVQCLISACFMGRRSVLENVGGFDEAFNPVEYEDLDLCYRLRAEGLTVLYEPDVEMYHFESVTTAGTASLPNTYLIIKHGLLFKKRWKHMFEKENGPDEQDTRWRKVVTRRFDEVADLPVLP